MHEIPLHLNSLRELLSHDPAGKFLRVFTKIQDELASYGCQIQMERRPYSSYTVVSLTISNNRYRESIKRIFKREKFELAEKLDLDSNHAMFEPQTTDKAVTPTTDTPNPTIPPLVIYEGEMTEKQTELLVIPLVTSNTPSDSEGLNPMSSLREQFDQIRAEAQQLQAGAEIIISRSPSPEVRLAASQVIFLASQESADMNLTNESDLQKYLTYLAAIRTHWTPMGDAPNPNPGRATVFKAKP